MGLADTVTKAYMKDNSVFADAFNYLIYGGEAVVDPKQLQELDTTEIALPFGSQDEEGKQPEEAVQKYRDVLKSAIIKQDDEAAYILLGIENQSDIHYAMPVRNIIYDALQYGKQVADIAAKHRASDGDSKGHSRGEYLSGFYKEDKITPVWMMYRTKSTPATCSVGIKVNRFKRRRRGDRLRHFGSRAGLLSK